MPNEADQSNRWVNAKLVKPEEALYEMTFYPTSGLSVDGGDADPADPGLVKWVRVKAVDSTTFRTRLELTDIPVGP